MRLPSPHLPEQPPATGGERLRAWLLDIWVMNSFSYGVGAVLELLIAGMSFEQHLKVRATALIVNTLTARPYGLYRDLVLRRCGQQASDGFWRRYAVDTFIFLSFQMPVYVGIMALSGAPFDAILKAALAATPLMGFLGGPYGVYLEFCKRLITPKRDERSC